MRVFIRSVVNCSVLLDEDNSVKDLENAVKSKIGEEHPFTLSYMNGAPLEGDDCILGETNIKDNSVLDLNFSLLGGRVHGSLARAGKVKNHTPNVDKQDKKKPPTGRAKRRLQYNRRFVIVKKGFFKPKGPNSRSK
ncbi:hypothetical protein SNEBB_001477 [Seison nebaliae]|nr:hypothetical protein SNEBB_001477 [Seison nebaliae]